MTYYLYLDDERNPKTDHDWKIVRSYDEFVETIITLGNPKYISFDHDLGEGDCTGYDCLKWYCTYIMDSDKELCEINFHTANPVGRNNMMGYLLGFKRTLESLRNIPDHQLK